MIDYSGYSSLIICFGLGFIVGVGLIIWFEIALGRHVAKGFTRGYSSALKKYGIVDNEKERTFFRRY